MRDFARLEAQLASLAAKTDALRGTKVTLPPPFPTRPHPEESPFPSLELAPAEGACGERWLGWGAPEQGDDHYLPPSHWMNFSPPTGPEPGSQAWLSQRSLQRPQRAEVTWPSPVQGGRLPASFPPWGILGQAAVSRQGALLQRQLRHAVAQDSGGLPQREEIVIVRGTRETLGQGRAAPRGEEEEGGKGEQEKQGSGEEGGGERGASPGFGAEPAAGEWGAQEVEAYVEGGLSEGAEGLRVGPEDEDRSGMGGGEGSAGGRDELGGLGQGQDKLEGVKGAGGLRGGSLGLEEGGAAGKGRPGEEEDEPEGANGEQSEGGKEEAWSPGSQEGSPGLEEDAGGGSSGSVLVPNCGTSEQ